MSDVLVLEWYHWVYIIWAVCWSVFGPFCWFVWYSLVKDKPAPSLHAGEGR